MQECVSPSLDCVAPRGFGLLRILVDGPVRGGQPIAHIAIDDAQPAADTDLFDKLGRGQFTIRRHQIAGQADAVKFPGWAFLRISSTSSSR